MAVFEIIRITSQLSEMIQAGETMAGLKQAAIADGMRSLRQSAMTRVLAGETSLEEALEICVNV